MADGTLAVTRASEPIATVARGGGVGEISLLAKVPCTPTVTVTGAALLYALDAEPFIEVVTSHPASAKAADHLVRRWMPMGPAAIVAGDPPQ